MQVQVWMMMRIQSWPQGPIHRLIPSALEVQQIPATVQMLCP